MVLALSRLSANEPATPSEPDVSVAPEVASASRVFLPSGTLFITALSVKPVAAVTPEPTPIEASLVRLTRLTATAAPTVRLEPVLAAPSALALPCAVAFVW